MSWINCWLENRFSPVHIGFVSGSTESLKRSDSLEWFVHESGIAANRFLPQSDPALQRNTKQNFTLKLQTFIELKEELKTVNHSKLMHDYICSWGEKLSVNGNKQTCGKGKETVRLCARSLYSASARVMYGVSLSLSLSFSISAVCLLKFQGCVAYYFFQCIVIRSRYLGVIKIFEIVGSMFICIIPRGQLEFHRTLTNITHNE